VQTLKDDFQAYTFHVEKEHGRDNEQHGEDKKHHSLTRAQMLHQQASFWVNAVTRCLRSSGSVSESTLPLDEGADTLARRRVLSRSDHEARREKAERLGDSETGGMGTRCASTSRP
jgi:hypothetical protein